MLRCDNRLETELREIQIIPNFTNNALGSILIKWGHTHILCTVQIEEKTPRWRTEQNGGWLTAEYSLLPNSTHNRVKRERNGAKGRTQEIERLIGRSLRSIIDFKKLPNKTIHIDCDVLNADGGTRCAAITGSYVALQLAIKKLLKQRKLTQNPITKQIAAISLGILNNNIITDLCYEEDSNAAVDANFIIHNDGNIVEIQGTGEQRAFSTKELLKMLEQAQKVTQELFAIQNNAL